MIRVVKKVFNGWLAPLNYDRFFKKVFSDLDTAKFFLEDFLDCTIDHIEFLPLKHKITDSSSSIEFDFRCKIKNSYIIIDMQQWYKPDIIKRFYVYHAIQTALQLDHLASKAIGIDEGIKAKEVKDYKEVEPVLTLIWMVEDNLSFNNNYISFVLTPENVIWFLENNAIWQKDKIENLIEERAKLLELLKNNTKELDFLAKNKLMFIFQNNIIKNLEITKYLKWFDFAEKTLYPENKEIDFEKYKKDGRFNEVIKRLRRDNLSNDDIKYIDEQSDLWEKVKKYERDNYELGLKDGQNKGIEIGKERGIEIGKEQGIEIGKERGIEIGKERGIEIGKEQGIEIGKEQGIEIGIEKNKKEMIFAMINEGLELSVISKLFKLTLEEVSEIAKKQVK